MDKMKCLLCPNIAEVSSPGNSQGLKDTSGGWKYNCPKCGLYSLNEYEKNMIEVFLKNKEKGTISEYVKTHQREDLTYFHLTKKIIEEDILGHPIK